MLRSVKQHSEHYHGRFTAEQEPGHITDVCAHDDHLPVLTQDSTVAVNIIANPRDLLVCTITLEKKRSRTRFPRTPCSSAGSPRVPGPRPLLPPEAIKVILVVRGKGRGREKKNWSSGY